MYKSNYYFSVLIVVIVLIVLIFVLYFYSVLYCKMESGDVVSQSNLTENRETMQVDRVRGVVKQSDIQASNVVTIQSLCDKPAVLQSGTVDATSEKGARVWQFGNGPAFLQTSTTQTRLSQVSQNFVFWEGTIHYRMVFTKTILQQTKFIVYWVPEGVPDASSVDEAVMFQHHVIINPDNGAHVDFAVPYISTRPYLSVTEATGMVYCRLFQPIVNNVDATATTLQYTLFVKSGDVVFRDLRPLPPPAGVPSAVSVPLFYPSHLYLSILPVDMTMATGTAVGVVSFFADSGVATEIMRYLSVGAATFATRQPVASSRNLSPEPYNPDVHRTLPISGAGSPTEAKPLWALNMLVATGVAQDIVRFVVTIGDNRGVWFRPLNAAISNLGVFNNQFYAPLPLMTPFPDWTTPVFLASYFETAEGSALQALMLSTSESRRDEEESARRRLDRMVESGRHTLLSTRDMYGRARRVVEVDLTGDAVEAGVDDGVVKTHGGALTRLKGNVIPITVPVGPEDIGEDIFQSDDVFEVVQDTNVSLFKGKEMYQMYAYFASLNYSGQKLPEWKHVGCEVQVVWQQFASAVSDYCQSSKPTLVDSQVYNMFCYFCDYRSKRNGALLDAWPSLPIVTRKNWQRLAAWIVCGDVDWCFAKIMNPDAPCRFETVAVENPTYQGEKPVCVVAPVVREARVEPVSVVQPVEVEVVPEAKPVGVVVPYIVECPRCRQLHYPGSACGCC